MTLPHSPNDPQIFDLALGYFALRKIDRREQATAFIRGWADRFASPAKSVLFRFLTEDATEDELIAASNNADDLTVAHLLLGEMELCSGNKDRAMRHFKWVAEKGEKGVAYDLATAELKR